MKHFRFLTIMMVAVTLTFTACGGGGGSETFTVTYNVGTGNTGGSVPVDGNKYSPNASVTVMGDAGSLAGALIRDGIRQGLAKWNTQADGSGTDRLPGGTFGITENTTLYAIYTTGSDVLRKTGPAGGWVFYDAGSVQGWGRYLECAPQATEFTSRVWGGYGTSVTGADGTAIGTGKQNTIDIVTQFGNTEPYENKTDYAAKLCSDLDSGGYDDWFLPSEDELDLMYDNLKVSGVGGFADDYYWSSSEVDGYGAWSQLFDIGSQDGIFKSCTDRVRAVRAF